jgi:lysozyme family protein
LDFERAFDYILRVEGGYSNHPDDPGSITKYGISQRAHPNIDVPNLTIVQAKEIYLTLYWRRADCESVPWPMNLLVFDTAVNSGVTRATRWLREHQDFNAYLSARIRFYTSLETWETFGKGWTNRIAELLRTAEKYPSTVDYVKLNDPLMQRLWDAWRGEINRRTLWRIRPLTSGDGIKLDLATAEEEGE